MPEKFETYQILRPNELVFKLIDLQNVSTSRVGRSSYEGIVSPAYIVLHERSDHSTKYAEYFFLAMWMHQIFNQLGADGVRSNIGTSALLNLPLLIAFHTQFIRYEHGPYDPELLNIEEILNKKGWYTVLNGSPVTYQKGKQFEEGLREYMDTFSDIDVKLRKIVGFLKPMKTSQAERVATLLAAWNDFIIDGVPHPTDKEIINEVVTHWTPNKANPQYSTWQDTLYKMRENQFVPKGTGVHTQQKKSQQEG